MKTITKLFLFVILLGVILLNTTCGKQYLNKYVTYEGYVYDKIGGIPVQGIVVVLNACGGGSGDKQPNGCPGSQFQIGRSTTDISGHFYIHGKASRLDYYYPQCDANTWGWGVVDGVGEDKLSLPYWTQIHLK